MKRSVVVLLLVLAVAVSTCFSESAYGQPGPKMVLPESVFSPGRVMEGDVIQHTFSVLNKGDRLLAIEDVRTDCGCATVEFDRAIPPGGEGKITLKVDTRGYEGKVRKGAAIRSNDPSGKEGAISIDADVQVPIKLSSGHVVFKGVMGQEMTKSLEILAQTERPLRLEVIHFDLDGKVRFTIEEQDPGKRFLIHVTSLPGAFGHYSGSLRLHTNYPEKREIIIPIRARFSKAP
ncbi:MAG: DUF1573 domain-containing protein [Thermodesulfobacteriota bacterium]